MDTLAEFIENMERYETPLSKLLETAANDKKAMQLYPGDETRMGSDMVVLGDGEKRYITDKGLKNSYNENNGVFNIYDEKGSLFVTSDAKLVEKIAEAHRELKQNQELGVTLSNGTHLANSSRDREWQEISAYGKNSSRDYYEQKIKNLTIKKIC